MRRSPEAIRQLLLDQVASGLSVAAFCASHELKVATFYAWRRKYAKGTETIAEGFCKIVPRAEPSAPKIRLPGGLTLELSSLTMAELAELIHLLDQAYA